MKVMNFGGNENPVTSPGFEAEVLFFRMKSEGCLSLWSFVACVHLNTYVSH